MIYTVITGASSGIGFVYLCGQFIQVADISEKSGGYIACKVGDTPAGVPNIPTKKVRYRL